MHCNRYHDAPLTRRQMLARCANGFGAVALAARLEDSAYGATASKSREQDPLAPRPTHHKATAKNVIFLFMDGGPSQIDTFDPKPALTKYHGKPMPVKVRPT